MAAGLTSVGEIERELSRLRAQEMAGLAQRTSVMTHCAWVPLEWLGAAESVLAGLAERHPSRTIVLVPEPEAGEDGIEAEVELERFSVGEQSVCTEVVRIRLRGNRAAVPASVLEPLLVADLPVFLRWRGHPPFGREPFEQMVDVIDRLIVDSTEWRDVPGVYAELTPYFAQTAVSDIAWARTGRWRRLLAGLWPGIAHLRTIRVRGTEAQAHLLAGWLRSRLARKIELEHEPAERLEGIDLDGTPTPFPPGDPPGPSDLLSAELDRFTRDPVYEQAVTLAGSAT